MAARRCRREAEACGEQVKSYAAELAQAQHPEEHLPLPAHILDPIRCSVMCAKSQAMIQSARLQVDSGPACSLPVVRTQNKFAMKHSAKHNGSCPRPPPSPLAPQAVDPRQRRVTQSSALRVPRATVHGPSASGLSLRACSPTREEPEGGCGADGGVGWGGRYWDLMVWVLCSGSKGLGVTESARSSSTPAPCAPSTSTSIASTRSSATRPAAL